MAAAAGKEGGQGQGQGQGQAEGAAGGDGPRTSPPDTHSAQQQATTQSAPPLLPHLRAASLQLRLQLLGGGGQRLAADVLSKGRLKEGAVQRMRLTRT